MASEEVLSQKSILFILVLDVVVYFVDSATDEPRCLFFSERRSGNDLNLVTVKSWVNLDRTFCELLA